MIRYISFSLLIVMLLLSMANTAQSAMQLYTGRMEILTTSGKGCEGLASTHDVSLVITKEAGNTAELTGYFIGGGITIGRLSGSDPARLEVRYPYQDELRATGHYMSLSRSDNKLVAELRDRHADAAADDCNFDLARLELTRTADGDADARLVQMTGLFDAQLTRSQALDLAKSRGYGAALPYFEKALVLADTFLPKGSAQIDSYIAGLATCYIWLDRFEDFNRLFDARIATKDASIRSIFSEYRARSLMKDGKAALNREEYDSALLKFEQAYKLLPQNREVIAAVMMVYMRSDRYPEAVSFLERSGSMLENESDRMLIRSAEAMVLFRKAQIDDKAGRVSEAENDLKRAIELDSGSVGYLIALARLRHKAGSLADAEQLLEQGLARLTDEQSQTEIIAARDKMRQNEMFLKKIRKAGN